MEIPSTIFGVKGLGKEGVEGSDPDKSEDAFNYPDHPPVKLYYGRQAAESGQFILEEVVSLVAHKSSLSFIPYLPYDPTDTSRNLRT